MSGQFMRLDDYAAMHGQYAAGDSRMYLRPEDTEAQESTVGDAFDSRGMTQQSIENQTDDQNYVTATSFGPTKQGQPLKDPQSSKEIAVNTTNDYISEVQQNTHVAQKGRSHLIEVPSSAEEGKRAVKTTSNAQLRGSDHVNTQRNTVGTDSKSKLNSIEKTLDSKPQLMRAEGSVTILRRNSPAK